jgi:hypothetical protein
MVVMNASEISAYTGLSESTVQRFLTMSVQNVYEDKDYIAALKLLNRDVLQNTLPAARTAYENHLEEFSDAIRSRYNLDSDVMSAFTLGNWVVGILEYPDQAKKLINMHARVPHQALVEHLPGILRILDEMQQGRTEWQKALCMLAFPLMAK